jgi:hypothetical protein
VEAGGRVRVLRDGRVRDFGSLDCSHRHRATSARGEPGRWCSAWRLRSTARFGGSAESDAVRTEALALSIAQLEAENARLNQTIWKLEVGK